MRFVLALLLLLGSWPAYAQTPVTVTGPITVGNCVQFASVTIIKDAGVTCGGGGGGGGIVIGTTTVTGAGAGQFLFNNAGVVGAATLGTMSTQNANAVAIIGGTITGLGLPTLAADAANKQYVDNSIVGLIIHSQALLATTTTLPANTYNNGSSGVGATLTGNSNGALTVDGILTTTSARIVVKNEAAPANNGIYVVTTVGDGSNPYKLTRATDANTPGTSNPTEIGFGTYVFVTSGSLNADTGWAVNSTVTTIGTDAINWAQFSVSGTSGAVGSVSNSDGSLTISPSSGNVVASLNVGHSNTFTSGQTISVGGNGLVMNTPSTGQFGNINFDSAGTIKFDLGKDASDNFYVHDNVAGRFDMSIAPNGNMALMPSGGAITAGAPTGGALGAGTINAQGLYVNGVAVGGGGTSLCTNPVTFGADPTGAADSAAAFNAALAASNNICFPGGKFKFLSTISFTTATNVTLSIVGAAPDVTELTWPSGNGLALTIGSAGGLNIRDLSITTGGSGSGVGLTWVGVDRNSLNQNDITRVVFRGDDGYGPGHYWATDLSNTRVQNINILQSAFYGSGPAPAGTGILINNATLADTSSIINVTDSNFFFHNIGFAYGANLEGVTIKGTNFVDNIIGIQVLAGTSGQDQLAITECQFGPATGGTPIQAVGYIRDFIASNNLIFVAPSQNGIALGDVFGATITGNSFSGADGGGANGVLVSGNEPQNSGTITGNSFFNLATGVGLAGGTSGWNVQANGYNSVTTKVGGLTTAPNSVGVATP